MLIQKDFELIARHLNAMYPTRRSDEPATDYHYRDGYNVAINQIAGACYSSNSRFDLERFKNACGVE